MTASTPSIEPSIPTTATSPRYQRFHLGRVLATPGALKTLQEFGVEPLTLIMRHVLGDWGDLCEVDRMANEVAVEYGSRIFSLYKLTRKDGEQTIDATIWVITEATDGTLGGPRETTTILTPEDY